LSAPLLGNTPTEYLFDKPAYEVNTCHLFSNMAYDLDLLKKSGQIVFNAVAEPDQTQAMLPELARLVDRLEMPVINHPAKIMHTTRDGIARLLQGIPDCRVAQTLRLAAGETAAAESLQKSLPFKPPLLARPAGTHGGKKFERLESFSALQDFLR